MTQLIHFAFVYFEWMFMSILVKRSLVSIFDCREAGSKPLTVKSKYQYLVLLIYDVFLKICLSFHGRWICICITCLKTNSFFCIPSKFSFCFPFDSVSFQWCSFSLILPKVLEGGVTIPKGQSAWEPSHSPFAI